MAFDEHKAPFPYAVPESPEAHAVKLVEMGVFECLDDGTIWRNAIRTRHGSWLKRRSRIDHDDGHGRYQSVKFWHLGKTANVKAHRLIWSSHNGAIPDGMQINHKDLNKKNNRIENLELSTQSENIRHALDAGVAVSYSRCLKWRGDDRFDLNRKDEARQMRSEGLFYKDIAERIGCSVSHAHRLVNSPEEVSA